MLNSARVLTPVAFLTLATLVGSNELVGQAPPDSVAHWTSLLISGTIEEKMVAYSMLGHEEAINLPSSTIDAAINELSRVHEALADGSLDPASLGGEAFGESYMDLVGLVASVNTDAARHALIGAVGVSPGVQRRVARLGDAALPGLRSMLTSGVGTAGVYRAYGYAWFWADSTGATLSDAGRAAILDDLIAGLRASDDGDRFVAAASLGTFGDPALAPLARTVVSFESDQGWSVTAGEVQDFVLPVLEEAASRAPSRDLLERSKRLVDLHCEGSLSSFCEDAVARFSDALDAFDDNVLSGAVSALESIHALSASELSAGRIDIFEGALVGGSAQQVVDLAISIDVSNVTADTYLKRGTPNKNQGTEDFLRIRSSGNNRALLRFDDSVFLGLAGQVVSARIEVDIVFNANNWGTEGRTVDVHRMLVSWTELESTWNCPIDVDTSDGNPDCDGSEWEMRTLDPSPYEPVPSATRLIVRDLEGTISFDVTADVLGILSGSLPNHGWIIRKTEEGQPGHIRLASRESGQGPRLVLEIRPD